jgi:hypothetical protein
LDEKSGQAGLHERRWFREEVTFTGILHIPLEITKALPVTSMHHIGDANIEA